MHFSSQTDPYRYDNEIDRMLLEMRSRRQEKYRASQHRQSRSVSNALHKKHEVRRMSDCDATLFTSTLERQKALDGFRRGVRQVPQDSFLKTENLSNAPNTAVVEVSSAPAVSLGPSAQAGEALSTAFPDESPSAAFDKETKNENEARILQLSVSPSPVGNVADLTQQLRAMQAQLRENEEAMDSLRRELRAAKNENAIIRREMYASMLTIERHLQCLTGDRDLLEGLEGIGAVPCVRNREGRPTTCLNPEEAEIVHSIESVIATCAHRLKDMDILCGDENSCDVSVERNL